MTLGMTPISLPGVSIRPPSTAPGAKNVQKRKKRKTVRIKPLKTKKPSRKRSR